jgi:hypothetical protein
MSINHRLGQFFKIASFFAMSGFFLFSNPNPAHATPVTFENRTDFAVGNTPYWILSADLNADGKTDLATANYNSNNISVLLGNGNGTFAAAVNYSAGTGARTAFAKDLNADGKLDLAVANTLSNNVSVLIGNGDGTFMAAVNYATGTEPHSVISADLNADGKPDLAVANNASNNVSILLGNGDGTFAPAIGYAAGTGARSVISADLNGDGKPDLATSNNNSNDISVLLGNGNGTFAAAVSYAAGTGTHEIITSDFNNDGIHDLATANFGTNNASVFLGNGDGTFAAALNLAMSEGPRAIFSADFDNDGMQDLAVANATSNTISIRLGNGDGTFGAMIEYGAGGVPRAFAYSDFNNDGNKDFAFANAGSNNLSIMAGYGDGTFSSSFNYPAGTTLYSVLSTDLNGDGKADLVSAANGTNNIWVLLGNGNGTFGGATFFATGGEPRSVFASDLNNDGKTDLVTANFLGNVSVLLGNGDGAFAAAVNYAMGTGPQDAIASDFNGDGKKDLACANSTSNNVSIRLGNGDGTFAAATTIAVGSSPRYLVSSDLNNDGKMDLTVSNIVSSNLSVLLGNGDGTFAAAVNYATGSNPRSVLSSDFNADGKMDLATANYGSNNMSVLLGNGNGTFAAAVHYGALTNPYAGTSADLNGDGILDLAVAHYASKTFSVFLGNGDGTFGVRTDYPAGRYMYAIAAAHFDTDGRLDIATANSTSNNVSVFLSSPRPKIIVSAISGNTTEAGGTATFTVKLNIQPTNNVTIGITSSDLTEGTVAPASLTFTNANWNVPQTVTLTGVDDSIIDGNVAYSIQLASPASTDPAYNGLPSRQIQTVNNDNDSAGFTVSPLPDVAITEGATLASAWTVVLTAQPATDVVLNISSGNAAVTANTASLTFTNTNWNTPKNVSITAPEDLNRISESNVILTFAVNDGLSDNLWDPIADVTRQADVTDNDIPGFTVGALSGSTTEAGGTATFTVTLNAQPTADVTIGITSSDLTEGTVAPASLTFTNANWNTPQTVTLTGVDDAVIDGNVAYSAVLAAAVSADLGYNGLNPSDPLASNSDNDTATVTSSPIITSGGGKSEEPRAPKAPKGGFKITLNQGAATTSDRIVTANFVAGTDVEEMQISMTNDFSASKKTDFRIAKRLDLCPKSGIDDSQICPDGLYRVSVRFISRFGLATETISQEIILVTGLRPSAKKREPKKQVPKEVALVAGDSIKITENLLASFPALFQRNLYPGMRSEDIRKLQKLLATQPELYPEGRATGFFGPLTQKAVQRFQLKYGVVHSRFDTGFGMVGPATREKLDEVFAGIR